MNRKILEQMGAVRARAGTYCSKAECQQNVCTGNLAEFRSWMIHGYLPLAEDFL
jgi:hypothetical protein